VVSPQDKKIDFGTLVSGTEKENSVTIKNIGDLYLNVRTSFTGTNAGLFSFVGNSEPSELKIDEMQNIKIKFNSYASEGLKEAQLILNKIR